MGIRLSDDQIGDLIREPKPLPPGFETRFVLKNKLGHLERELAIAGQGGNQFRLIFRKSQYNPLDFSIILALIPKEKHHLFRLRRYNGKSHQHSNAIEGNSFYDFHIHFATDRYQERGWREDAYAEASDRFSDFETALICLLEDCAFQIPPKRQQTFFGDFDL